MEFTIQPNGLGGHYALYVVGKGSYMAGTPSAIGAYNVVNKGAGPLSEKAAAQKMIDNAKMQMESDQRQMENDKSGFPN